jgi:hypothetical protein
MNQYQTVFEQSTAMENMSTGPLFQPTFSGAKDRLLVLHAYNKLGQMWLAVTNAPVYKSRALINAVKSFILHASR